MSDAPQISDGARLLRHYLDQTEQSVPVFCERHGLCRIQVQRVLNGERRRISVDFAWAIEQATSGAVPWRAWRQSTLRSDNKRAATGTDG